MTRKVWFTTFILIPAFFLITLGMRNPFLDNNHGPKPRPRAVLEEKVSKSSFVDSCQFHVDADVCRPVAMAASSEQPLSFVSRITFQIPDPGLICLPSRASPSRLCRLS
jgi:hypothetical protein